MILTAPMSCPMNQSWHPTERSIVNRLNLSVYRMLPAALFARVRSDNAASVRVLERSGFVFSGNWPGDSSRHRYEVVLTD